MTIRVADDVDVYTNVSIKSISSIFQDHLHLEMKKRYE